MTVYNHMYMPVSYGNLEQEYFSILNDVSLWDVSCQRQVEISGHDAARFMQYVTPRDVTKCKVTQCKYILLTTDDGGIVNDPVMLRLEENKFWLSLADNDVILWLHGLATHMDMKVDINEPDVSPLQLQGPKSTQLMEDLFGAWINDLKFFWLKATTINNIPAIVTRTGYSGEKGYEIYLRDSQYGPAYRDHRLRHFQGQPA